METEGGTTSSDNSEHAEMDQCLNSGAVGSGVTTEGGRDVSDDELVRGLKNVDVENEVETSDGNEVVEGGKVMGLKKEAVNNGVGVAVDGGNGVLGGGVVMGLKKESVNNGMLVADGNGAAEAGEVWGLEKEAVNNGVEIANGNCVAEGGKVCLKNEAVNNGVAIANGNGVAEGGVVLGLKKEVVNNGVVISDRNGLVEDEEVQILKKRKVDNGVMVVDRFGLAEEDSSGNGSFQTYKRRKHAKSSSESKLKNDIECEEATKHLSDQALKNPCDLAVANTSKDRSHGYWGNVVLQHLYNSLLNDNGSMERGIQKCIWEALLSRHEIASSTTVMETFKIHKDGQECSLPYEWLSHRLQSEANGHANVMHNGSCSESDGCGATERCQHVLSNILASDKFSSLCKVLNENFPGMTPESTFDFTVINSRMKEQAYEQRPSLFLSDVQEVWRKLQNAGNEIVAIVKSLSNISKAFYCELVGVSSHSSLEDEKQVFFNQESNSHVKPEQMEECAMYKICACRQCGEKADGTDCLVCDSCEEMYHVSCIEPAVKEIPHKNWFCANCTARGIGSRHENCVVCERLTVPKTLDNIVGEDSIPTNEEVLNDLEEDSNCTYDGTQVSIGGRNSPDCKICQQEVEGEQIKICRHPFCPSKYYHLRCLSSKEVKSYGRCWYCPSCLCRVCLIDQDDDKIVLCDGCDHAYHIYCMKPPRTSIPKGKWFCRKCDAGIQAIRQARKAYESNKGRAGENDSKPNVNFEKKWNNERGRDSDKVGGMDMLLTAANTLKFQENLAANKA